MTQQQLGLSLDDIQAVLDVTELDNQTVSSGGNFAREKMKPGKHRFRLVGYIETGVHDQPEYQGTAKAPADEVFLTFEFLNPSDITENDDGTKRAIRKTFKLKMSNHEKATYRKLFEKMREGDTSITHMSQMLGKKAWMMNVVWSQNKVNLRGAKAIAEAEALLAANKDDKNLAIWDNMRDDAGFMVSPAVSEIEDEETGEMITKPVKVPPVVGPLMFFLWDTPKANFWASLHIEGSYTKTVDGKEIEVSKNRFQEACMAANNYKGSPLENMLDGLDDLPTTEKTPEGKSAEPVAEEPKTTASAQPAMSPSKGKSAAADKDTAAPTTESADTAEPKASDDTTSGSSELDEMEELGL